MSLPVYFTLSDYGRKVLSKSRSEKAKKCTTSSLGSSFNSNSAIPSDKDRTDSLSDSKNLRNKNKIHPTPTPPNSPNYENIQKELTVKIIEEPYSNEVNKEIDKPKPDRTSFKICTIM